MKALLFREHGSLEVLRHEDVPDPRPGPGQVVVEVKACGINHLDVWVRRGWPGLKLEMPHWGGADIAGVVAETGPGVTAWKPGQRVVCDPGVNTVEDEFTRRGEDSVSPGYAPLGEKLRGGCCRYALLPAGNLQAMPDDLDFPQAAAPLLVTLTAWRMLVRRAGLRPGETVLVVGAGGGVNSMAIQVARLAGATVLAVAANAGKAERAHELGAHQVFDRSRTDWGKEVFRATGKRGADVVVDNVGAATIPTSIRAVARGGRIVIVGNTSGPEVSIDLRYLFSKQISLIGSTMGSHQDFLDVTALLWSGRLKPVIDRVVPLSEGREAFLAMEKGEQFGKIVLVP